MSNRSKFVDQLSANLGLTKKAADELLVAFTDNLRGHLESEGEAVLPGFGRMKLETRAARNGRNPKTGEPIAIPEKQVVKFKVFPGGLE